MRKKDKEEIDYGLKLLVKSSVIIFVGLLLSKIFTYAYRIIIARSFGPEIYGIFSLAVMISGWFVIFSSFGFSEGLLRYVAFYRGKKDTNRINYLFRFTILISIFSSIIAGVILFFLSEFISLNIFHSTELIVFLKIFSFVIPFYVIANIFISILQAFEKISWYSFILNILQNVIKLSALILLILFGLKINSITFSYLLGIFGMFLISYLVCKYKLPELSIKFKLKKKSKEILKKEFFSYSWPLLFSLIISDIFYGIDSFAIGYFMGVKEVGIYNSAIPIVLFLSFAPEIFIKLFFPLITKKFSINQKNVIQQLSQQVGKWVFILNLPIMIVLIFFPGVVINLLFGSDYLPATNAFRILAVGSFFLGMAWIPNRLLSMMGRSKLILITILSMLTLNVILNILLIPVYGIDGAALATTISKGLLVIAFFIEVKFYMSFVPLRRKVIRIFFLSLIPLAVSLIFREIIKINWFSLSLIGIMFISIYLLLILLFGGLDNNDFMILKSIKRKILR